MDTSTQSHIHVVLSKRTEKLVSAMYLVTDFLADTEPIKCDIRKGALRMAKCVSLADAYSAVFEIEHLRSLLRISKDARIISEMNFTILERASIDLRDMINTEQTVIEEKDLIFDMEKTLPDKKDTKDDEKSKERPRLMSLSSKAVAVSGRIDRKKDILDIVRSKGHATVSDIKTVISDVSDKTIQRDLTSLMKEGLVEREGERRWAKYRLV